jgi:hypothetical protein
MGTPLLKIKQMLLDSCTSKRMQAEDKHKPLDQSSQPRTDPEASKQYSDSFPLISFKSQQAMSPTAAFAMLEPENRSLLLTGKNYTLWAFWIRARLLKKGLGVICSEDKKDSRLTPEKEIEAFDLLLSSMTESTLSRVLTATSARDIWVILRKLYAGKHASTALAYEYEIHQQRYKDGTSIEDHFNNFRVLVAQYHAVGGTMSDVSVALAMLRPFNDSATYKGIIATIRVSAKLEELTLDEIESKMVIETRDIDVSQNWNPDSEHPNIRRAFIVEELIHLKGPGSNILTRDRKRRLVSFPKRRDTRKIQTSLEVQVQQCMKSTVSWLELDRKNGSLTQEHPLR